METDGARVVAFSAKFDDTNLAPKKLFLDTSVVIALRDHEMACVSPRPGEKRRGKYHAELVSFLSRARASNTQIVLSPGVVEELLHLDMKRALDAVFQQYNCSDSKELRRKHPVEHKAARHQGIKVTKFALASAGKHGAKIVVPVGESSDLSAKVGSKMSEMMLLLVEKCDQIGCADALHIVNAELFECKDFASGDGDFRFVRDITVFCENPSSVVR